MGTALVASKLIFPSSQEPSTGACCATGRSKKNGIIVCITECLQSNRIFLSDLAALLSAAKQASMLKVTTL